MRSSFFAGCSEAIIGEKLLLIHDICIFLDRVFVRLKMIEYDKYIFILIYNAHITPLRIECIEYYDRAKWCFYNIFVCSNLCELYVHIRTEHIRNNNNSPMLFCSKIVAFKGGNIR